jgi:diacylglycerol kinase (ATP)
VPNLIAQVYEKFGYSLDGLRSTWADEPSFRQWTGLVAVSDLAALVLPISSMAAALVFAFGFLLLAAELINSGLEAIVDKTTPEVHPLAKKAKDAGSAMTLVTFLALVSIWIGALLH